jgi:hypothetical protein
MIEARFRTALVADGGAVRFGNFLKAAKAAFFTRFLQTLSVGRLLAAWRNFAEGYMSVEEANPGKTEVLGSCSMNSITAWWTRTHSSRFGQASEK